MTLRRRKCKHCGEARTSMIKPEVQDREMTVKMQWLCFPCFLDIIGLPHPRKKSHAAIQMNMAWKDVET